MLIRRFSWQIYILFAATVILVVVASSEFAGRGLADFYTRHTGEMLASRAHLAGTLLQGHEADPGLDAMCKQAGADARVRLTVVDPSGRVLADSSADPRTMDNHAGRPEVVEALAGRTGIRSRMSATVQEEHFYAAAPMRAAGGAITGVARVSMPMGSLRAGLEEFRHRLMLTSLGVGALVLVVVVLVLRRLNRPLGDLRAGAGRFAGGDLTHRLPEPPYAEFRPVVAALNSMAAELGARLETVRRQRDEMQAVLGSMREAVIAVDAGEHILQVNPAGAVLLGGDAAALAGHLLPEVLRNTELLRLLREALSRQTPAEGEVEVVREGDERILQVHATPLRGADGGIPGAMIVANDVTRLRRLERVRRDFVANVSHELRTPLTSIRGFVETLQEGAMDQPEEARRFLGIIARQSEHLNAILEDLLSLSSLDQQEERGEMRFQEGALRPVLASALELCAHAAARRNIPLTLDCPEDARLRLNAALFEQAVANLVGNAIKYSEPGRPVRVEAGREKGGWAVRVIDQGCGIEAQHLARIFERFYRVDKARSRAEGGTGLGLAIVKHIAILHGGRVSVESEPGQGSTFAIHVPVAMPAAPPS